MEDIYFRSQVKTKIIFWSILQRMKRHYTKFCAGILTSHHVTKLITKIKNENHLYNNFDVPFLNINE